MASIFSFSKDLRIRYMTLIATIKACNSTFYDAYNNFVEELLKSLAKNNNISHQPKASITSLIDNPGFRSFLTNSIELDSNLQNKIKDYALKINKHKHKLEKTIQLDNVINYMTILYELINKINAFYHFKVWHINANEYVLSIYNQNEKLVQDLKKELIVNEAKPTSSPINMRTIYQAYPKKIISSLSDKAFARIPILIVILLGLVIILNACDLTYQYRLYAGYCQLLIIGFCFYGIPYLYYVIRIFLTDKLLPFNICIKRKINYFRLNRFGYYTNSRELSIPAWLAFGVGILTQVGFLFMDAITKSYAFLGLSLFSLILEIVIYRLVKYFYFSYQVTIIYTPVAEIYLNPDTGHYQIKVASK